MNYIYLNKLKDWDEGKNWKQNKISESEITDLQSTFALSFPIAYKEFLLLSGGYFSSCKINHEFDSIAERQIKTKEKLKEFGLEGLIKKDFWVIGELDGCEYINYIYLDEGDNPPVYALSMEDYAEDSSEDYFSKINDSFSEWIEKWIASYELEQKYSNL
jgi:hypothetical protein